MLFVFCKKIYTLIYNQIKDLFITVARIIEKLTKVLGLSKGTDYKPKTLLAERLCLCGTAVQTIGHVLLECPLLDVTRAKYGISDVVNGL